MLTIINSFYNSEENIFSDSLKTLDPKLESEFSNITFREVVKHELEIKKLFKLLCNIDDNKKIKIYKKDINWIWTVILLIIKNKFFQYEEVIEYVKKIWKTEQLDFPFKLSVTNLEPWVYNVFLIIHNLNSLYTNQINCCKSLILIKSDFDKVVKEFFNDIWNSNIVEDDN